jgi:hypothetical protein
MIYAICRYSLNVMLVKIYLSDLVIAIPGEIGSEPPNMPQCMAAMSSSLATDWVARRL